MLVMMTIPSDQRNVKNGRPGIDPMTQKMAIAMYNCDCKVSEICETCHMSRATFYRILKQHRMMDGQISKAKVLNNA